MTPAVSPQASRSQNHNAYIYLQRRPHGDKLLDNNTIQPNHIATSYSSATAFGAGIVVTPSRGEDLDILGIDSV